MWNVYRKRTRHNAGKTESENTHAPPVCGTFSIFNQNRKTKDLEAPSHSLLSAGTHSKAVDVVPRLEFGTHARFGHDGVKVASKSVTMRGASQQIWMTDVRFGSKADIALGPRHVRFTPESGHRRAANTESCAD